MSADEQRKLAAIMFTDMVGYSALSQRDEKLAQELLEEHRRLLREIFPRFNGTEIKTIGDAFLVEFGSALEAAQCAIEIQRTLAKRNADIAPDRRHEVKIGIHIGDVGLRRPKTAALLGPAPRRSALRENRRLPRAKRDEIVMLTRTPRSLLTYSARNATIGSTRLALRAGTQQASSAMPNKSKATHVKVIGSEVLTP